MNNHKNKKCKNAFTLAEVLITLAIIGVVAALTMPTLISKYKDQVTISKLKKSYSVLNQAYRMSENVNGPSEYWENSFDMGAEAYYEKYWKPFFNNPTLCLTAKDCGYKNPDSQIVNLDGSPFGVLLSMTGTGNSRIMFYLNDGTLYTIMTTHGDLTVPNYNIYIDINGGKNPNTVGRDVFIFTRVPGKGILPYGYDMSKYSIEKSCSSDGSDHGSYCAARIMRDGWKIKY